MEVVRYVNGREVSFEELKNYTITDEIVLANIKRIYNSVVKEHEKQMSQNSNV